MLRLFILILAILSLTQARTFTFTNNLPYQIAVGTLGNAGIDPIAGGLFTLAAGESRQEYVEDGWAGRIWGKSGCQPDGTQCLSGDAGVPASLAEITTGDLDFYDVSLVDGFNLPVSFGPVDAAGDSDGGQYSCVTAACAVDINLECPDELKVVNQADGSTVACLSACARYATDEYCCGGECCGTPDTCVPSTWPVNYNEFFKERCPLAYSYAYDDQASTFTCRGRHDYFVTFG